ncbi:MAG: DUF2818 family protein [Thiohalomonadaceae bacterium]
MQTAVILVMLALLAANLPWLSERILLVRQAGENGKRAWWRWLEWVLLYFIMGGLALGLEKKLNGEIYPQDWEFYAVTLCLFLVFALPGFLYRYEVRHLLKRR